MDFIIGFILVIALMLIVMPYYISFLKNRNINQVTSEYALDEFKNKQKTPIMGGLLFVIIPIIVFMIVNPKGLADKRLLFVMLSYILYCVVGTMDDILVIRSHSNDGLSAISRLIMEFMITTGLYLIFKDILPHQVTIPFIRVSIQLNSLFYIPFMTLLYMAEANAVNFTDGMDGLCAGVSFIALMPFVYLVKDDKNVFMLLLLICAGLLGYLRFNFHPAKIFMGDSGSLALGALFASLGLLLDQCFALFVIGGVFVVEMFCVVLQQLSVRLFKKRVFSYTPIHYAFVIKGYKESNIVTGFYLVQLILSIIGLFIGLNV